ncbi:hypothetical protein ACQR3P_28630 [Rhodococcus sp. IEGM1300]
MGIQNIVRQAARNGKKYNVNRRKGAGPNAQLNGNRVPNPVTQGLNEPNVRVSPRMKEGKRRIVHRDLNPLKTKTVPGPNGQTARMSERLEGNLYGRRGSQKELLPAIVPKNDNIIEVASEGPAKTKRKYHRNKGNKEGKPMPRHRGQEQSPTPKVDAEPAAEAASRWRGIEDIKNTATGQAPLSTFFRNREARDSMMASGEGASHKWAKGSTSWGRVAGTGMGVYAGVDTLDRMTSGGSITRNETGRFDMMGIPIL